MPAARGHTAPSTAPRLLQQSVRGGRAARACPCASSPSFAFCHLRSGAMVRAALSGRPLAFRGPTILRSCAILQPARDPVRLVKCRIILLYEHLTIRHGLNLTFLRHLPLLSISPGSLLARNAFSIDSGKRIHRPTSSLVHVPADLLADASQERDYEPAPQDAASRAALRHVSGRRPR